MKYYHISMGILLIILLVILLAFLFRKMTRTEIYNGELKILYEDNYIIVIDKPVNISVHDAPEWDGAAVVNTLQDQGYALYRSECPFQIGVVHRLDVGTSGILILAKTEKAYRNLKYQFKYRKVIKIYHALIQGETKNPTGTINEPLGMVNDEDNIYGVVKTGKPSVTHYKTLKVFKGLKIIDKASLVEINLQTGRTHQIRVHFSNMNHPLVGDVKYGSNLNFDSLIGINHQWLHAKSVEFKHPITNKRMHFNIDYPEYLKHSLYLLEKNKLS